MVNILSKRIHLHKRILQIVKTLLCCMVLGVRFFHSGLFELNNPPDHWRSPALLLIKYRNQWKSSIMWFYQVFFDRPKWRFWMLKPSLFLSRARISQHFCTRICVACPYRIQKPRSTAKFGSLFFKSTKLNYLSYFCIRYAFGGSKRKFWSL